MTDKADSRRCARAGRARTALAALAAAVPVVIALGSSEAPAQFNAVGRGPSINVGPRVNITPNLHYSPNNYGGPAETDGYVRRQASGPTGNPDKPPGKPPGKGLSSGGSSGAPRNMAAAVNATFKTRELVIEVAGNPTEADANALALRFGLLRVESQNLPLIGSTIFGLRD